MLIASLSNFKPPVDGSVAIYIDDSLAARLLEWPPSVMLPQVSQSEA